MKVLEEKKLKRMSDLSGLKSPTLKMEGVKRWTEGGKASERIIEGRNEEINVDKKAVPFKGFLSSFVVDSRGCVAQCCRHHGIKFTFPPTSVSMPTRVYCKMKAADASPILPPLNASSAFITGLYTIHSDCRLLRPITIEISHCGSFKRRDREMVVLVSRDGQDWCQHQDATSDCAQGSTPPGIRTITTNTLYKYICLVSSPTKDCHSVGGNDARNVESTLIKNEHTITSSLDNRISVTFSQGAIIRQTAVALEVVEVDKQASSNMLKPCDKCCHFVSIEPNYRRFHKLIKVSMPLPEPEDENKENDLEKDAKKIRFKDDSTSGGISDIALFCNVKGEAWTDITSSTDLHLNGENLSFSSLVSARFCAVRTKDPECVLAVLADLFKRCSIVPMTTRLVVYGRRCGDGGGEEEDAKKDSCINGDDGDDEDDDGDDDDDEDDDGDDDDDEDDDGDDDDDEDDDGDDDDDEDDDGDDENAVHKWQLLFLPSTSFRKGKQRSIDSTFQELAISQQIEFSMGDSIQLVPLRPLLLLHSPNNPMPQPKQQPSINQMYTHPKGFQPLNQPSSTQYSSSQLPTSQPDDQSCANQRAVSLKPFSSSSNHVTCLVKVQKNIPYGYFRVTTTKNPSQTANTNSPTFTSFRLKVNFKVPNEDSFGILRQKRAKKQSQVKSQNMTQLTQMLGRDWQKVAHLLNYPANELEAFKQLASPSQQALAFFKYWKKQKNRGRKDSEKKLKRDERSENMNYNGEEKHYEGCANKNIKKLYNNGKNKKEELQRVLRILNRRDVLERGLLSEEDEEEEDEDEDKGEKNREKEENKEEKEKEKNVGFGSYNDDSDADDEEDVRIDEDNNHEVAGINGVFERRSELVDRKKKVSSVDNREFFIEDQKIASIEGVVARDDGGVVENFKPISADEKMVYSEDKKWCIKEKIHHDRNIKDNDNIKVNDNIEDEIFVDNDGELKLNTSKRSEYVDDTVEETASYREELMSVRGQDDIVVEVENMIGLCRGVIEEKGEIINDRNIEEEVIDDKIISDKCEDFVFLENNGSRQASGVADGGMGKVAGSGRRRGSEASLVVGAGGEGSDFIEEGTNVINTTKDGLDNKNHINIKDNNNINKTDCNNINNNNDNENNNNNDINNNNNNRNKRVNNLKTVNENINFNKYRIHHDDNNNNKGDTVDNNNKGDTVDNDNKYNKWESFNIYNKNEYNDNYNDNKYNETYNKNYNKNNKDGNSNNDNDCYTNNFNNNTYNNNFNNNIYNDNNFNNNIYNNNSPTLPLICSERKQEYMERPVAVVMEVDDEQLKL